MSDFKNRILYRKDERGVIVESGIFGPDDEVPEGFGTDGYTRAGETLLPVAEAVPVVQSRVSEADVSRTATIDETIDQEFVPEAAGEVAEGDEGETLDEAATEAAEDDDQAPEPPPQGGPGSGVDAWRTYADELGVEVAESATRDDIIAAVKKAGHPV